MPEELLVIMVEPIPAIAQVLKEDLIDVFLCQVEIRESTTHLMEEASEKIPALIVLDIETPGAQRFIMNIKDDPNLRTIPVIGANLVGAKSCAEALNAAYDGCFTSDLPELEKLARKYLPERPVQEALA